MELFRLIQKDGLAIELVKVLVNEKRITLTILGPIILDEKDLRLECRLQMSLLS